MIDKFQGTNKMPTNITAQQFLKAILHQKKKFFRTPVLQCQAWEVSNPSKVEENQLPCRGFRLRVPFWLYQK